MGSAADYLCTACGYRAERVTANSDFGFSGIVVTPVVCAQHGIMSADTGMNVMDGGPSRRRKRKFPCPECGALSPRWDRRTCPECGQTSMGVDPTGPLIDWD